MDSKEWRCIVDGQAFLISTSRDLLPHSFVQEAFDNPDMYWAKPPSTATIKTMLDNSCALGLYKLNGDDTSSETPATTTTPIGMARMVTDYVTFAYLTDVYVVGEYRKFGLGTWMIHCCGELVQEMPQLRWMLLMAGSEHGARMYQRELGMQVLGRSDNGLFTMGARRLQLQAAASSSSPSPRRDEIATPDASVEHVEDA